MGEQIWLHFKIGMIITWKGVDKFSPSVDKVKYIAIEF
jgi:hypothetical protein